MSGGMSDMAITIEDFAESCIKPAANSLLLRIAKLRGFSDAETQALVVRFEADPMAVGCELFGLPAELVAEALK